MLNRLSQYYCWPGMRADVQKVCENCIVYASTQGQELRRKSPLYCIPVGEPFECIGMDLKELDISEDGNRYGLRSFLSRIIQPPLWLSVLLSWSGDMVDNLC